MSRENVNAMRKVYEAMARGDFSSATMTPTWRTSSGVRKETSPKGAERGKEMLKKRI